MDGRAATAEMDGGWKQLVEDFPAEFFQFFFPKVHDLISFSPPPRFLDTELPAIVAGFGPGKRHVDKLLECSQRNRRTRRLLVHVEVQFRRDSDFAQRMFVYNVRIWHRYGRPVMSVALLIDDNPKFRPNRYCHEAGGCRQEFTFPIVKLLDFKTEGELLADPSPMAVASLVQLRKLQAGRDTQRRFAFKVEVTRELYGRRYSREDTIKLFRFVDFILKLPKALARRFRIELAKIEEERNMPYLSTYEQQAREIALAEGEEKGIAKGIEKGIETGIEKGIEKGVRQGIVDLVRQTLEVRFGQAPQPLLESIERCENVEQLRAFHKHALTAQSLDELRL